MAVTANPLNILSKDGCKVQSLTVSDQHATLLLSHDDSTMPTSLLKLTLVPFHKEILGSNPVVTSDDNEKGTLPERNLLQHDPLASQDIISFLKQYDFVLKSESGAEYSYYEAIPKAQQCKADATTSNDNMINTDTKFGTSFNIELISPASPHQITRAMPTLGHVLINETAQLYVHVVQPYIQSIIDNGSLSWIQNVIEVKKEKERLLVNNEKFLINIDTKWRSHPPPLTTDRKEWYNHPSTADLYCLGIVKQSDIRSIRDLKAGHIPLLKSMAKEGLEAIQTIYGIPSNQIRIFVHYVPQFYHFHIHFTRLENEVGCSVERAHLVSDIIQNLGMDSGYYRKRMLTYKLKKGSELENLIENAKEQYPELKKESIL